VIQIVYIISEYDFVNKYIVGAQSAFEESIPSFIHVVGFEYLFTPTIKD
jgi:hypothetical protein